MQRIQKAKGRSQASSLILPRESVLRHPIYIAGDTSSNKSLHLLFDQKNLNSRSFTKGQRDNSLQEIKEARKIRYNPILRSMEINIMKRLIQASIDLKSPV